jgi:hypothetical protein
MLWDESGLAYRGAIPAFAGGSAAMRTVSKVDVTAEIGTWLNNNNKLQLVYRPVAVAILHVHKYEKKVTRIFKSGGLHERHVVATWKLGNHLNIRL